MHPQNVNLATGAMNTAQPPVSQAYDLNTPLLRLLEDAIDADICLISPGRVQLGACCSACAGGAEWEDIPAKACSLVKQLAGGDMTPCLEHPPVCDAGRHLRIHMLESGSGTAMMALPRNDTAAADLENRLPAVRALWQRCERLQGESEGLALEVIRSYEQLNVIFDVTQEICNSHDPAQIRHFLIRRLAQTLNCDWSCCISPVDGVLWWCGAGNTDRDQVIAAVREHHFTLLNQVMEQRNCLVVNHSEDGHGATPYSYLFATLGEPDVAPDLLILARAAGQPEFIYGDVMMIDSMLSHAQHVLSNLKLVERLRTMSLGAVRALVSAIDKKDHYTSGHSERVGFLSQLVGQHMGLPTELVQDLEWGGLLHDVGKIGISDGILCKPGGLTSEEFGHIKQHVIMSYEIVAPIECMTSVRDIVLYHHEVPDGSGYPKGLKGDEIPLPARIVHVVDTFDALTTSRSYRKAFPLNKAFEIMEKEKGTKLEASIVDHFRAAFEAFKAEQPDHYRQLFSHLEEEPS